MARLRFGTDELGKEILELVPAPKTPAAAAAAAIDGKGDVAQEKEDGGKPYKGDNVIVMMEWERPYMRALVDNLGVTGATVHCTKFTSCRVSACLITRRC